MKSLCKCYLSGVEPQELWRSILHRQPIYWNSIYDDPKESRLHLCETNKQHQPHINRKWVASCELIKN